MFCVRPTFAFDIFLNTLEFFKENCIMITVREIVKIRSLVQNTARVTAANGNVSPDTGCFKKVDIQPVPLYRRISGAARIRLEL